MIGKKAAAFIAFNAYLFAMLFAFFQALPELFRLDFLAPRSFFDLTVEGALWDNRYLLFLLLSLAGTSLAAFLAGGVAQVRGGVAAAKGAVPLILIWTEMFFLALFTGTFGAAALALTVIPLTIVTSAYWGKFGERIQKDRFPEGTIFGVHPYHYLWMIVPFFLAAFLTASWLPYLEGVLYRKWRGAGGTLSHLLNLVYTLLPPAGLGALLYIAYKTLAGGVVKVRSEWVRALFTIGLLIVAPVVLYQILLFIGWLISLLPLETI